MYLPSELTPDDTPVYLVVTVTRATGAHRIENIETDLGQAERMAEIKQGFVLEIDRVADYR